MRPVSHKSGNMKQSLSGIQGKLNVGMNSRAARREAAKAEKKKGGK